MSALLRATRTLLPTTSRSFRQQAGMSFFEPSTFVSQGHGFSRLPKSILRRAYNSGSGPEGTSQTNMHLLYGFMGINCGVFGYAMYLREQARQGFPGPFQKFMANMTLNLTDVRDRGRWWTTITSVFTHVEPFHIIANMLSFYYMGQLVALTRGINPIRMVILVLGSGLTGSLGYLYQRSEKVKKTGGVDFSHGLGFSGAVMGIGTVAACMYPKTTFQLYGIVPVPLWGLMAGYLLYDGFHLNSQNTRTGHAGHLGGMAFGIVYYFARLRGVVLPNRWM